MNYHFVQARIVKEGKCQDTNLDIHQNVQRLGPGGLTPTNTLPCKTRITPLRSTQNMVFGTTLALNSLFTHRRNQRNTKFLPVETAHGSTVRTVTPSAQAQ